jgi:hypothetical protein
MPHPWKISQWDADWVGWRTSQTLWQLLPPAKGRQADTHNHAPLGRSASARPTRNRRSVVLSATPSHDAVPVPQGLFVAMETPDHTGLEPCWG